MFCLIVVNIIADTYGENGVQVVVKKILNIVS